MFDPLVAAARCGLRVEVCDLGAWGGGAALVSEYDGRARTIRINTRALEAVRRDGGRDGLFALAVAHELYHHREATGEIARLPSATRREAAADAFARSLVPVDGPLAAFFANGRAER